MVWYRIPSGKLTVRPENHQFLEETNLSTPMTARVYVNLLEGSSICHILCVVLCDVISIVEIIDRQHQN
jgi:hypothetical protein